MGFYSRPKMKYNIPKKFIIGGQEIKVQTVRNLDDFTLGLYVPLHNMIKIRTHVNDKPIHPQQVEQTFWHEYAHCLLLSCRKQDLYVDEELVDLMGEFLYQSVGKKAKW